MILTIIISFLLIDINADYSGFPGRISVPTGKVAVFYRNRVIQNDLGKGPVEYYNPIFTDIQMVDINRQKDSVPKFTCVAKDDQMVTFPKIDITNQLPIDHVIKVLSKFEKFHDDNRIEYDKPLIIDETINYMKELCIKMTGEELRKEKYDQLNDKLFDHLTEFQKNRVELNGDNTGIRILRVFVETPTLDENVEKNRREIAIQKTAKQAEEYRQQTKLKEKETTNMLEELEAQKKKSVMAIENQQKIDAEEAEAKKNKIKAESEANELRILADARSYEAVKVAQDNQYRIQSEAQALKDSPEYLRKLQLESFGCQNSVYWGNDLPDMYLPQSNTPTLTGNK